MKKKIRPTNMLVDVTFEDINSCPICNAKISPIYIVGKGLSNNTKFSLFCECPSCGKTFVAFYKTLCQNRYNGSFTYEASSLEYLAPIFPKTKKFDEKISSLFPSFVEIYNQALSAETYNLNQISGIGYRKALEFLIKDYCIYKHPDKKDEIVNMFLGNCINTYIDDSKIKNIAKVSVWLGNDETHYIRKFENTDVNDLKRFIDTVLYFILYNLNADEAEDIVNSQ